RTTRTCSTPARSSRPTAGSFMATSSSEALPPHEKLQINHDVTHTERMLPLYEAKMIHHYDTRWATYEPDGTIRDVTLEEKRAGFAVLPRYWVHQHEVDKKLEGKWDKRWLLGWRDICRSTDERTTIATKLP